MEHGFLASLTPSDIVAIVGAATTFVGALAAAVVLVIRAARQATASAVSAAVSSSEASGQALVAEVHATTAMDAAEKATSK